MKITQNSPNFGMKLPIKTVMESATGAFLDDAKIAYPRQIDLLEKLSGLNSKNLYSGEVAEGFRNMRNVIREKFPDIALSAERLTKEFNEINADRTFLPEDEILVAQKIDKLVAEEIQKLGISEVDMDKIPLKDLGLDKYI